MGGDRIAMKFGVAIFPTHYTIRPAQVARAAEERGFESLFFPEHTHIPVSRRSPYPGGGQLPREYIHTLDLFVALTSAAMTTKKIRLATGICLLVERDPITVAKEVASLDVISEGRVIFGIGGGWNAEEMENHGTSYKARWKVLHERVEAIKEIWTKDEAQYHGEFVKFDPLWSFPKPMQKPHPPIILGNNGPGAVKRVAKYCDGWLPHAARMGDLARRLEDLRREAERNGRDPKSISVSVFAAPADKGKVEEFAKLGVERVVFYLPSENTDTVLSILDKYAAIIHA
jgi:probable F420-dependent oxidoreductase